MRSAHITHTRRGAARTTPGEQTDAACAACATEHAAPGARVQFMGCKVVADTVWQTNVAKLSPSCPACRGCGIVTCPRCRGSGNIRARPARLVHPVGRPPLLVQRHEEVMPCFACGTRTKYDYHGRASMGKRRALQRFFSLNIAAHVGARMPVMLPPTQGTVLCPGCNGTRTCTLRLFQGIGDPFAPLDKVKNPWLPVRRALCT